MKSIVILGSVVAVLVLSAMPGVAYLSTTAVYAVGGKEKNKVSSPRKNQYYIN
jgi:hypothetical protein